MMFNIALAHSDTIAAATNSGGCPMCQWMMGGWGGPFWGGFMMFGMLAFWVLLLVIMVLLVVWLLKQIKK